MKVSVIKRTLRSIRDSKGRFVAMFLIVALGVGFFAGLKLTQSDMQETLEQYLDAQNMYDFRLISTMGFNEDNVRAIGDMEGVGCAEGSVKLDALVDFEGNTKAYSIYSIPSSINKLQPVSGRLPEDADECVVDADFFDESDVGKVITISDENTEDVISGFSAGSYTIVGRVESPLYISRDRGTTTLAGGSVYAFVYLMPESFTSEYYTDVYVTLLSKEYVYSDAYDDLISDYKPDITEMCGKQAELQYEDILASYGISRDEASYAGMSEPDTYVLTRSENSGYVSFENDTAIVSGIANVFPVFFIMIGMLVCMTTMGRMVAEERTQTGVLKALGVSDKSIIMKYMLYVGIATVGGFLSGYILCTLGIPQVFWYAYEKLYNFSSMKYRFNLWNMLGTFVVAMVCTLGSTYYSCRHSLHESPAMLIRPKTPKVGRRILLERVGVLWNRLTFMHKVSIRNMFLSKNRFWMMIIGISGCTALLVTGFGIKDSLPVTGKLEYEDILRYEIKAELSNMETGAGAQKDAGADMQEDARIDVGTDMQEDAQYDWQASDYTDMECTSKLLCEVSVDVIYGDDSHTAKLWSLGEPDVYDYLGLTCDGEDLEFPKSGEVLLSMQMAEKLGALTGDTVTVRDADMKETELTVSGIFDNYLNSYAIINDETMEAYYGAWTPTSALICTKGDVSTLSDELLQTDCVSGVTLISDRREVIDSSLECLDYIILMIILFAGALAFVVIFNLTNINLAERNREVATVKVLGFYPRETGAYVLQENVILSFVGGLVGIPLGILLHRFVLNRIEIEEIVFPCIINPSSYLYAYLLTILFATLVNLYMYRRIDGIHMAESLKSVE